MDYINAHVVIEGTAPYSQSKKHEEPWLEREQDDAYEKRTWRSKMTTAVVKGSPTMVIPPFALQMTLLAAAQYLKRKIEGQGNATWTDKFRSGLSVMPPGGVLGVNPADVKPIAIFANSDGRRGGGKRVTRYLPQIPAGWKAYFDVIVLDPIIVEDIFTEVVEAAGLFRGIGQFRPENGGSNGRFIIKTINWEDNRQLVQRRPKLQRESAK
jgi:hypothetical protein